MSDKSITGRLEEMGYRMTPQRLMIVSAIEEQDGGNHRHISAEEIYSQVVAKYPHINLSTIYRTLDMLEELGLVTRTDMGEGKVRYHPADEGRHHHMVCRQCGAVIDLDESILIPIKKELLKQYGFTAELRHLAIFGHCEACRK
jgi:Fur family ferric uptake transcriptional regulator